ncbi:hypothetical protein EVAR_99092_1 [Eumeta japonica]|uniref:Uncharacterized protein n=1 Tax=Eumeta variegata TaxID=151549 RepID=A0A4C1ZK87_EUMVA|nr:hypothetical protein EVAR_99092_1 [Eumeta japonica]
MGQNCFVLVTPHGITPTDKRNLAAAPLWFRRRNTAYEKRKAPLHIRVKVEQERLESPMGTSSVYRRKTNLGIVCIGHSS